MAAIHVLDPHTAELIAAGEVVERPASVVKELTENAIDAGARTVTVSIERGGTSVIQIADDGSGIEAEDIPTAFIRHATSKIERGEDLERIHTLGFRGEALASVASVARVELLTRTPRDEYACLYRIEGGAEQGLEPAARPVGTTITVRDLFYNTPARMKFLKKDASEGNYVADVVTQLALSHPEISFRLMRDGKTQFCTPGDGRLQSAAYMALSREFARGLIAVEGGAGCYAVQGLVTPPRLARASRSMQFFYINGRFVKNRTVMAALEAAYKGMTMQGKFPGGILFLTMPPQLVDVNVHPAKTEVRFAREKDVFDAVYQSVKGALLAGERAAMAGDGAPREDAPAPAAQAETGPAGGAGAQEAPAFAVNRTPELSVRPAAWEGGAPCAPGFSARGPARGGPAALASAAPMAYRTAPGPNEAERARARSLAALDIFPAEPPEAPAQARRSAPEDSALLADAARPPEQTVLAPLREEWEQRPLRLVGEIFRTYIVAERGDTLCLLDKHAAHERLIYESLAASYGNVGSQQLLAPVTVQLCAEEKDALLQSEALLRDSGLEIEDFGGGAVVARAVPADVEPDDVEQLVVELAGRLALNPRGAVSEKTEWVLHSIACRAAMKAGDKTPAAQLLRLAQDVLDGKIPPFCPHGRPIVLEITKKELEKRFGRQG